MGLQSLVSKEHTELLTEQEDVKFRQELLKEVH